MSAEKDLQAPVSKEPVPDESAPTVSQGTELSGLRLAAVITDQFKALEDVGWYGSSYLLVTCMFQLIFGKLYGYFPIKWVFLTAIIIFEIGSAVCGAAPTSDAFIPVELVLTASSFYINLPIGGVVVVVLLQFLHVPNTISIEAASKSLLQHMDPLGAITFLPAIVCLLLALQWGGTTFPWANGRIIALFVLAGMLLISFLAIQRKRQDNAMVPPRVITMRPVACSSLFMILFAGAYFTIVYYLPIWFQAIKDASAVDSGIMCLPVMLSMVIFSFVAGGGVTATGNPVPFFYIATVLAATGAGLMTTFEVHTGHPKWIGYQVLLGSGVGMGIQLPIIAVQAVLPAADIPVGTAIVTFCQTFGGAIFVSVAQALFANQLRAGLLRTVPGVSPGVVQEVGATNLDSVIDAQHMSAVKVVYNDALVSAWYLAVALFAVAVLGAVGMSTRRKHLEA
ncbi:major facilitator superfamily domain-containing protein [Aspergillus lucknowensis]|uniref:Major facilitator superfamily domain-containing protein n=1 Tax=Aspergillus lucknowensis TaxID=176173 RepID=A0ABR4LYU4_9EURO